MGVEDEERVVILEGKKLANPSNWEGPLVQPPAQSQVSTELRPGCSGHWLGFENLLRWRLHYKLFQYFWHDEYFL